VGQPPTRQRLTPIRPDTNAGRAGGTLTAVFRRLLPLSLAGILSACGGAGSSGTEGVRPQPSSVTSDPPASSGTEGVRPQPSSVTSDPPASEPDGRGLTPTVPDVLRFSAPLVGGGEIELATLAGRPVLLWFWAPW
jgi:hypothetical protein